MRPIWSGILSFGLINIPIRVYSGTRVHEMDLDMLHKKDLARIRYAYICTAEEKEVPYKEIVKGYKADNGEYVVLEDEDFERARSKKTKAIEIEMFTYEREIDSIYFEKPYFLEPDKDAHKAYNLLREALSESEKVAIASFVLRNRKHMAVVKPYENALILNQLRFPSEIRDLADLNLTKAKVNEKEVSMAIKLIDQLTEPFDPSAYSDTYEAELKEIVQAKLKGKKTKKEAKTKPVEAIASEDILSKLKASLKQPSAHKPLKTRVKVKRTVKR